jgi:myo-inositol-1(or 4)-monophosphatase
MNHPILNIAVRAARAAGNVIIRAVDKLDSLHISEKRPHDYVTEIDQQAEREIITIIRKAYPQHAILAEESGESAGEEQDYVWVIDPLDGTRNFIHGFPHFAVSIGVSYKGKMEHAAVYDPIRQELFTATRGKGAHLNDRRIRVSKRTLLEESLIGTGYPHCDSVDLVNAYTHSLKAVISVSGDVRRAGAAALDLAYVASGRLDGFWEIGLKKWDVAAGSLLVKEAGGLVSDFQGSENYLTSGDIIAGTPKVFKSLLQTVSPHLNLLK